jgi:putative DNA primase/helicase
VTVTRRRKGEGQAIYRATGSLAFVAAARAAWAVCKGNSDSTGGRRLFLPIKNNVAPLRTGLAFSLRSTTGGTAIVEWDLRPISISADDALAPVFHKADPIPKNAIAPEAGCATRFDVTVAH